MNDVKFRESPICRWMIVEFIANLVHPVAFMDYTFIVPSGSLKRVTYSSNTLIVGFMLTRVYLILRLLTRFTKWRTDQAEIICQIEGFQADTVFSLKAMMKDSPATILLWLWAISIFVLGLAIWLAELPFYEVEVVDPDSG